MTEQQHKVYLWYKKDFYESLVLLFNCHHVKHTAANKIYISYLFDSISRKGKNWNERILGLTVDIYENTYVFGEIKYQDAVSLTANYLTSLLNKGLSKYESIFNKQIICHKKDLYLSICEMLETGVLSIDNLKGVSKDIRLVPTSYLIDCLEEYCFLFQEIK